MINKTLITYTSRTGTTSGMAGIVYIWQKNKWRIVSTSPDLHNQLINIDFLFEWDEGRETRQQHWLTPLRYFFRFELEHLVERSDFKNYKILGDFQGNELNDKSVEFIVICSK